MKKKLFLDADGTIVNLIKAVTDIYHEDYHNHPNYKRVEWFEIETWGFEELTLTTKKNVYKYFEDERLFNRLEFLENANVVLDRLSLAFDIYVVTMGSTKNLELKEKWFKENLPYAKFIGCDTNQYRFKSHIDMSDGIFIDDRADNLENSNATVNIVYGDIYEWNCRWEGMRCWNWCDVESYLM